MTIHGHIRLAVEELLESEDITLMDWPAYSPDLNPIEHLWDALGRVIAARLHDPENTQQLKKMLIEEWVLLPQEMLHQLVLCIRRRCEATIAPTTIPVSYLSVTYTIPDAISKDTFAILSSLYGLKDSFLRILSEE
ncbi:transposable element Tcb2 transposase [Trichonephila clavipes]|nr:transposable element Tcb2 transposase [Trichonephila clavipes]